MGYAEIVRPDGTIEFYGDVPLLICQLCNEMPNQDRTPAGEEVGCEAEACARRIMAREGGHCDLGWACCKGRNE